MHSVATQRLTSSTVPSSSVIITHSVPLINTSVVAGHSWRYDGGGRGSGSSTVRAICAKHAGGHLIFGFISGVRIHIACAVVRFRRFFTARVAVRDAVRLRVIIVVVDSIHAAVVTHTVKCKFAAVITRGNHRCPLSFVDFLCP